MDSCLGYRKQRKERLYDALFEYFDHDETETFLDDIQDFIAEQTKYHSDKILDLSYFSVHLKS